MMKKVEFLVTVIVVILCSACYKNPIERNTIVFEDSIQNVQDSLLSMRELLSIMPRSQTVLNTNYYFQENTLYINNSPVGDTDSIILDTVKAFSNFSSIQKESFINLTKYLRTNYITSGYLDKSVNWWLFTYRYLPNGDFHDTRDIVILSDKDTVLTQSHSKVLDHKKRIFLLAPRDAKIR